MPGSATLVSVVIPAYNAAAVIEPTLRSVSGQTHAALEILVVDDGSTDATADVVRALAAEDGRIRLIQQPNGGVCAARNRGIGEAAGPYVALLDADDLWAPAKIEKQLAALARAGPRVGLCYTQFVIVDGEGRVTGVDPTPRPEGPVLREICSGNFVGHGSSALVPKAVLEEVGMFATDQVQGCEDHRLYFHIAERYEFACVQEPLVGYRMAPGSASGNTDRMIGSWPSLAAEMRRKHPEYSREIARCGHVMRLWAARASLMTGRGRLAARIVLGLAAEAPLFVMREMCERIGRRLVRRAGGISAMGDASPTWGAPYLGG